MLPLPISMDHYIISQRHIFTSILFYFQKCSALFSLHHPANWCCTLISARFCSYEYYSILHLAVFQKQLWHVESQTKSCIILVFLLSCEYSARNWTTGVQWKRNIQSWPFVELTYHSVRFSSCFCEKFWFFINFGV